MTSGARGRTAVVQLVVVRFDRAVAFACGLLQALQVGNVDTAAAISGSGQPAEAYARPATRWCAGRRASAPRNSWVSCIVSPAVNSCVRSSQRARRASSGWLALQAADCWACMNSACSCRISMVRNEALASAAFRSCSASRIDAAPGVWTIPLFSAAWCPAPKSRRPRCRVRSWRPRSSRRWPWVRPAR